MSKVDLHSIAAALVAKGKGILAADESEGTANKRLESVDVEQNEENRRLYRQLFFTTSGIEKYLSGVILHDSTLSQQSDAGERFVDLLEKKGVIPGIKVDKSTVDFVNFPGEKVTEGLDGLLARLVEYADLGMKFTKWRSVAVIGEDLPTDTSIAANAHGLAMYAVLAQEVGLVPIVEPEVLIDGSHTLQQSEEVTRRVLEVMFQTLSDYRVAMDGLILKSSMVISGKDAEEQASADEVARATLRVFEITVPSEVPGIVFLSGGQAPTQATDNLRAVSVIEGDKPWGITFSFARALQGPTLEVWKGDAKNVPQAQQVFLERLEANSRALSGE